MKRLYFLLALLPLLFLSCEKNDTNNDQYVNSWIYNQMSIYYLWNDNLPTKSQVNFNQYPENFFYSLLYRYQQPDGDRFSWIRDNYIDLLNSLSGVSSFDIGFEYIGYPESTTSQNVIAQVAYVKPGTHAEQLGVKRGDIFKKVNGAQLTRSNWRNMFNSSTAKILFERSGASIGEKTISLSQNYSENPIYLDTVYNEGANKVGYLVYNFFAEDNGNGSNNYDLQLNEVFGRFKDEGIKYLILDLRYNNGGSMNSATLLGSMIVPGLSTNNIFTKLQYNSIVSSALVAEYGNDILLDKFKDKVAGVEINNIGDNLQGLYILTGNWTASASELVINNLTPYFPNIDLIGDTTVGKNVGSISLYEGRDSRNKWGMQPIVLKFTNKLGTANFSEGFIPNIVDEDNNLNKLELGNKNEAMLAIALSLINGTYSPSSIIRQSTDRRLPIIGSSIERRAWSNRLIVDSEHLKQLKINKDIE